MNSAEMDRMMTEAKARITWGDSPSDVYAYLISQGVADFSARAIVRDCRADRAAEMRVRGLRDMMYGVPLVIAGLLVGGAGLLASQNGLSEGKVLFAILGSGVGLLLWGGWRLMRALERLVFGAWADGAVTDVDD